MKRDGGPAFPRTGYGTETTPDKFDAQPQDGMSLRDHFAGVAPPMSLYDLRDLAGWPKDLPEGNDGADDFEDSIINRLRELTIEERLAIDARFCYLFADAMLTERSKQ